MQEPEGRQLTDMSLVWRSCTLHATLASYEHNFTNVLVLHAGHVGIRVRFRI